MTGFDGALSAVNIRRQACCIPASKTGRGNLGEQRRLNSNHLQVTEADHAARRVTNVVS